MEATENVVAGHIWPAGRYTPTPGLKHFKLVLLSVFYQKREMPVTKYSVS